MLKADRYQNAATLVQLNLTISITMKTKKETTQPANQPNKHKKQPNQTKPNQIKPHKPKPNPSPTRTEPNRTRQPTNKRTYNISYFKLLKDKQRSVQAKH